MVKTILFSALLGLLAVGCSRDRADDAVQGATSPATDDSSAVQADQAESATGLQLADGYIPTFAHRLRSQRHEASGTKFRHVVIVEFLNVDAQRIIAAIQSDLSARGFIVETPVAHADAIRVVARKNGTSLVADVHDSSSVKLNAPDARGIVYFTWLDSEPG